MPKYDPKSSLSGERGKGGNVTSASWQVTLCDPMWHVSSRSGMAILRTAIHLLLAYLLLTYLTHGSTRNPRRYLDRFIPLAHLTVVTDIQTDAQTMEHR